MQFLPVGRLRRPRQVCRRLHRSVYKLPHDEARPILYPVVMKSQVIGTTMPVLEFLLEPNDAVISEAGELVLDVAPTCR
jgi:hypothetical protein